MTNTDQPLATALRKLRGQYVCTTHDQADPECLACLAEDLACTFANFAEQVEEYTRHVGELRKLARELWERAGSGEDRVRLQEIEGRLDESGMTT